MRCKIDIPDYGVNPVNVADIVIGDVYFSVIYHDDDMLFPTMQPLVFLGAEVLCNGDLIYEFQHVSTYHLGQTYDNENEQTALGIVNFLNSSVNCVYTFENAVKCLVECWNRRKGKNVSSYTKH